MIQAAHPLTVTRRCELLDVARSTVYYHPTGIPSEDLALMRLLDEIHLERPFYGSRRLRDELETQGHPVNRKRVQRLMRQMGLSALYPKPRTPPVTVRRVARRRGARACSTLDHGGGQDLREVTCPRACLPSV